MEGGAVRLIDGLGWTWPSIASKTRFVEVRPFSDPTHIIDDEMDVWSELWQRHDKISAPVPDGAVWDSLAVPFVR